MIDYKLKDIPQNISLEDITAFKFIKPSTETPDIFNLKFIDVENIKEYMGRGKDKEAIKCLALVLGKDEEDILELRLSEFFAHLNSIKEQLTVIIQAEQRGLQSKYPDVKWEAVEGSKKMAEFGIYNTLDLVSNGDITKWEDIKQLPYSTVFIKLRMITKKGDLEKEMMKIKNI